VDTGNCSEHPLAAFRRYILFSYAGNRELKYRDPPPGPTPAIDIYDTTTCPRDHNLRKPGFLCPGTETPAESARARV
jgi:hypothetical protein